MKTKTVYYVDLINSWNGDHCSVYRSENIDEVRKVYNTWNKALNDVNSIHYSDGRMYATIEEVEEEIEEVQEMKKYTLENYREFCENALVVPPFDENEPNDWDEWFEEHKIHITVGNHDIELTYHADNVNEIEYALKEMYEVEMDIKSATTGNTVGSQYRPAKMIDFIRVYIDIKMQEGRKFNELLDDVVCGFNIYYFNLAKNYIKANYKLCCNEYECDFSKFDVIHDLDFNNIEDLIIETVCTKYEVSYDEAADRSYIVDFSLRNSGEFVGWTWGSDENDIKEIIRQYKVDTFGLIE